MANSVKSTVFIHTNSKQMLGAIVGRHSLKRNSANPDAFDVRITSQEDFPFFAEYEGKKFLRGGAWRAWENDDLQSFTPVRFTPPELMGYQGRAVMVDPDVFAVGDVMPLLTRDMGGSALMARKRGGDKEFASSVMLMDCAKLTHWQVEKQFNEMFDGQRDYMEWISLKLEPKGSIGELEAEWNDFDHLTPQTKLLHNTKRWTQPWKTGLPVDFTPSSKTRRFAPLGWFRRAREAVLGRYGGLGTYKRHPDPKQEVFFFGLLAECVEKGEVSREMVEAEMAKNHVRHDAFEVMARAADTTSRAAA